MALTVRGQVGPQVLSDGTEQPMRLGKTGEVVVTEFHGKYYEQTYRGNVFVATAAAAAMVAAASTSMAPLGLYNPASSGKNVILIRTIIGLAALPGTQVAGAFAYYVQSTTQSAAPSSVTNADTILPTLVGAGNQPVCKAYKTATLAAAPTLFMTIAGKPGVAASASTPLRLVDEPDGAIILTPGSALVVQETIADTTSNYTAVVSFIWEEMPI